MVTTVHDLSSLAMFEGCAPDRVLRLQSSTPIRPQPLSRRCAERRRGRPYAVGANETLLRPEMVMASPLGSVTVRLGTSPEDGSLPGISSYSSLPART